jgi:tRNA threonylcarbamoyl adenosine modification protein YjeE
MGRQRISGPFFLSSAEETLRFGAQFATQIQPNQILALRGDLGAGKTTFMQGLLAGLKIADRAQSPTFTLLQSYEGPFPVHHFDLYRIESSAEFCRLGFEEFLQNGGFAAIEWPEKIESLIPPDAWLIDLTYSLPYGRSATVKTWKER